MNRSWGRSAATLATLLALVLAASGCGDDKPKSGSGATTAATGSTEATGEAGSSGRDTNGCKIVDEKPPPKKVKLKAPTEKLDRNKKYVARLVTNCGVLNIELDVKKNPKTAASFAHMTKKKLFDDTWFHRIVNNFVIQGGDPKGDGTGGAGYKVVEEPRGKYYLATIAMAKGGAEDAGASSSQFFIITGTQGIQLPPDYAIAGRLANDASMDTMNRIAEYGGFDDTDTPTGIAVVKSSKLIVK